MGGKDSKQCFLTYEGALSRVTEAELKRLKDAFKRSSTLSGYMTKPIFIREVLGDGVPAQLAEHIYTGFGGSSKGLNFKDLVCGLVLLTRGRLEEKIKFIFGLYGNETLTHVQKEEMDRLVLATEGQVPQALSDLFLETDRVSYELFRQWVLCHPDVTSLTRWLLQEPCSVTLSNDMETPTFYQTLAGVTHLEETDIIELEKRYWTLKAQSKTGRFDVETFKPIICPPVPESLCEGVFIAFDENRDNHIDFKEMACGISACCRGPMIERQKFCFKIFDTDHDGLLSRAELETMVEAMLQVRQGNKSPLQLMSDNLGEVCPKDLADEILQKHDSDKDDSISQGEYLVWTVSHPLPQDFLSLLFQVCHIVLGLKPQTKEEEGQVVRGWMEREERRGLQSGQTWYLVAMHWWKSWLDYVYFRFSEQNLDNLSKPQPSQVYLQDGSVVASNTANKSLDSSKKNLNNRSASSLCRNLGRKPSNEWDDQQVVVTNMTGLPDGHTNTWEERSNTLPRVSSTSSAYSSSSTPGSSPRKPGGGMSTGEMYSGRGQSTSPSPSPSPKMNKRSVTPMVPQKPGAIDNTPLIVPNAQKVMVLTNEGGRLKRNTMLARGRDFELLPEPVWKALSAWYGGSPALPRNVITISAGGELIPELELYPIAVRLLRHQLPNQRTQQSSTFTGMIGGLGGMAFTSAMVSGQPAAPKRYLAYMAAFSRKHTVKQVYEFLSTRLRLGREDIRLWKFDDEQNMHILEDEEFTMEKVGIDENQQILIEVRNKDLTWPEEMSQLAKTKASIDRKLQGPTERGASGLNNLGNTCFMNSAVQCVSNTRVLTLYFTGGMHLYELNRANPLGMKGHIAQQYGDLVKDLWSGTTKTIAPLKLRWTIGKYAPRFNGFQQHDAQELLAFLLDGLHEDLNRVHLKPYVELKDSDGRPDEEVAREAWDNHLIRNRSIVVDLFHGQLKSCVRCLECGHTSVRFDPFTYLSLPLPMDSCIHLEIIVLRLDGSMPTKYGMRLNMDEKYRALKKELSLLASIPMNQILLVEIFGALVKSLPYDNQKIKTLLGGSLYAYELPPASEIQPMTAQEEKGLTAVGRGGKPCGLNQIQRIYSRASTNLPPVDSTDLKLDGGTNRLPNGNIPNHPPDLITVGSNSNRGEGHQLPNGNCDSGAPDGSDSGDTPTNNSPNGASNGSDSGPNGHISSQVKGHQRDPSTGSSTNGSVAGQNGLDSFNGFVVAVHRKMIRMDVYFLSSQKSRPSLFGTPLILPCDEKTTNLDLYRNVWTQVSRLVSPLPPSEVNTPNHAMDCDDSLGYEYPFTLKVVQKDGVTCAWCPWYRFCRGCKLECSTDEFNFGSCYIAVDWEPTALHLRYQSSQERVYGDHASVEDSRKKQTEPIDLDECLKAFTKEEELGEDELYYCSKCKAHRLAAKKLEIWKLPPILIIHLKRFQFLNGRWVKSQKIVKFPIRDFDPTNYLAPRTPKSKTQLSKDKLPNSNGSTNHDTNANVVSKLGNDHQVFDGENGSIKMNGEVVLNGEGPADSVDNFLPNTPMNPKNRPPSSKSSSAPSTPRSEESQTLGMETAVTARSAEDVMLENLEGMRNGHSDTGERLTTPVREDATNSHPLVTVEKEEDCLSEGSSDITHSRRSFGSVSSDDYTNVRYQLYAMSCHTGILGGGHYVAYGRNPNEKWYCYNDSSCKEVADDNVDTDNAYILFYERRNMDYGKFMPDITGKEPDTADIDEEFESDLKKMCVIQ